MDDKEKFFAGEVYTCTDELVEISIKNKRIVQRYNEIFYFDQEAGRELLSQVLVNADVKTMNVCPVFACDFGFNIYGGENAFINNNCTILDTAPVYLGKNLFMGPHCQIYAPMHPLDHVKRAAKLEWGEPIRIGDDCWLGGGVIICPGVTIGDRVVIGAGSVVTKDIPSDSIVAGNPAKPIKSTAKI